MIQSVRLFDLYKNFIDRACWFKSSNLYIDMKISGKAECESLSFEQNTFEVFNIYIPLKGIVQRKTLVIGSETLNSKLTP